MSSLVFIIWMQPIIFMIHDFEEIIMAEVWSKRYEKEIPVAFPKKQPFGNNYIRYFKTPTLSIGVAVEFLLFTIICLLSFALKNYFIWFIAFSGVTLHLVLVHMVMCIKFKHYVPGVITSVILTIPSIWLQYQAAMLLHFDAISIVSGCLLGAVLIGILIPFLHKKMAKWSEMLYKYADDKNK
jgi:hypothetical protein